MAKQIIGWGLIGLGVLAILWAGWSSYEMFTGQKPFPEIFSLSQEEPNQSPSHKTEAEEQIEQVLKNQLEKIIPQESAQKMLNLSAWALFVFILIYIGFKLASLGIKLLAARDKPRQIQQSAV